MRIFGADPLVYLSMFIGLAFVLALGYVTQQVTMMPVFQGLILWPFLIWALRYARIGIAIRFVVFWAAVILLGSVVAGLVLEQSALAAVPGSLEFNAENMRWWTGNVTTVQQPQAWLPPFLGRTGLSLAGGALTAGLVPAIAGARSLAMLGLWIATLFGAPSVLALPLAIPLWTWAELLGQIVIVVVVAEPIVTGDVDALLTYRRKRLLLIGFAALGVALLAHLMLPTLLQPLLQGFVT
ncbi:MAG: hypothetical protein GY759_19805 [Chloroflexi bacterium]|nr:hypothetical protein [Chloroflexota bacterium]